MKAEFSEDVRETMTEVLSASGFTTPEAAAWEVSLTVALAKVSQYERECLGFRRKYGESLESVRNRVEGTTGSEEFTVEDGWERIETSVSDVGTTSSEEFTVEDDLADWEFAERALALWQRRVEVLRRAAP